MPNDLCMWYRAALRDDLIAARQVSMIREQFADALGAAGWPDGACLFLNTRHAPTGRVRDDHNAEEAEAVFFSPAARAAVPHLIAMCGRSRNAPARRSSSATTNDWDLLPRQTH